MIGDILATALEADENGLCAVPVATDGSKAPYPDSKSWIAYQSQRPTRSQLKQWFDDNYQGIGLICGQVSGGLEMLEFEGAAINEGLYERLEERAKELGLDDLIARIARGYEEYTPGGGIHWFYRCDVVAGNTPLARRPAPTEDNPHALQVLIETRGEGGFAIIAPSGGPTHPTGDSWGLQAGSLSTIETISPSERAELHRLCASFDRMPPPAPPTEQRPKADPGSGKKPGQDFNERAQWSDILVGWEIVGQHGDETLWRRPGKNHGVSAVTNHTGSNHLKVFTTSTPLDTAGTYTKFGAYTALNYNGDHEAAARALGEQGYGEDKPTRHETRVMAESDRFASHSYLGPRVLSIPPPVPIVDDWLFTPGESVIYAPPKAGKTFFALDFALSVATGRAFFDIPTAQGFVVYIAAEGVGGLANRVSAWCQYHGLDLDDTILFTTIAVNLLERESVDGMLDYILEFAPDVVVFDTLARCSIGAEENSAKDMGYVTQNIDRVRDAINGHVMLVHHSGKDVTRGMRGSSALLGAVDTAIELDGSPQNITVRTTAQKEAEPLRAQYAKLVGCGLSAVITPSTAEEAAELSANPVLDALRDLAPTDRTVTKWKEMVEAMGINHRLFYPSKAALERAGLVFPAEPEKRGTLWLIADEIVYESEIF